MLRVGLNPYGLTMTLGLQGQNTDRANPHPMDLMGYIEFAREIGATGVIELPGALLRRCDDATLAELAARLRELNAEPILSLMHATAENVRQAASWAELFGASIARATLTSILCGDRAEPRHCWPETYESARRALNEAGKAAADLGLTLAIENHQDLTSDELVELCETGGSSVGICLDTANPLAVGEEPVQFARTVAPLVRHVHLKDYDILWTDEGYRLVRCAIGEGVVPLVKIAAVLEEAQPGAAIPAAIEGAALEARHVRLLTDGWWEGYSERSVRSLVGALAAARVRPLPDHADWRTPWERGEPADAISRYEIDQMRRSAANLRALGWL